MTLIVRLSLCALLALLVVGCGNKRSIHTMGEVEGIYLDIGELNYQVQISRALNGADVEDQAYLRGLPVNAERPQADETYFGVFLRVQNTSESESIQPAQDFEIIDSQEKVYRPIPLDPEANTFAYNADDPLAPGDLLPHPDSVVAESQVQGALLLFKIRYDSLQNRPLEFKIRGADGEAVVDLDI